MTVGLAIASSALFLDGYLSPVVRFGMVVSAKNRRGTRICLTYDDADKIIKYIVLNGHALSDRLINQFLKNLGEDATVSVDRVDEEIIESLKLETGAEISGPGLVTGANLPEFILSISGMLVLLRTSFTICVDDDRFGLTSAEPLQMHSKIWVRMILISEADEPSLEKLWSHGQTSGYYQSLLAIREAFDAAMLHTYGDFIARCTGENVDITSIHKLTLATFGASRAAFNDILSDLPKRELLSFRSAPHWPGHGEVSPGSTLNSLLSYAGLFLESPLPQGVCGLTAAVDALREQNGDKPAFKIVSVDDDSGIRGVFLAEITNKFSIFVGVAADQELEFNPPAEFALYHPHDDGTVLERVRVARAPANQVATILSVDIATGL